MTTLKIIFLVLLAIIFVIVLYLNYIGYFSKIDISEKETGPFVLVYKEHKGDYKGTAKIQDDVYYTLLKKYNLETYKGFGIYYDDPKKVKKEDLRSIAGCILEERDYSKVEELKQNGLNIKEIPKQNSLVVEFPYKNAFSIFVGILKVYPVIDEYAQKNNLIQNEIMEIYDVPNKKIIYIKRIAYK